MGKFKEITTASLADSTIYAESIPHFLHWDIAYKWILEMHSAKRPGGWTVRASAWVYLTRLLLTGKLKLTTVAIPPPMAEVANSWGMASVTWASLPGDDQPIAVLSPTVLIRPLPDFKDADLAFWKSKVADVELQKDEKRLKHFIQLLTKQLGSLKDNELAQDLSRVLENELGGEAMDHPPSGDSVPVKLAKGITWTKNPDFDSFDILISSSHAADKVFLPKCATCANPLTYSQETLHPVTSVKPFVEVSCRNCNTPNQIMLVDLLVWYRQSNDVIVWSQNGISPMPEKGYPPKPAIDDIGITFAWDPAQLGGETTNRFLHLTFSGSKIRQLKRDDITFRDLLIPGELNTFSGLPFKLESLDAIPNLDACKPTVSDGKVIYSDVAVNGIPNRQTFVFSQLSLKKRADIGVGVYPNPKEMPDNWKWFRVFADGPGRREFNIDGRNIDGRNTSPVLPWLIESLEGPVQHFSVTAVKTGDDIGVTYVCDVKPLELGEKVAANIHVGVDFGTTNSIAYFLRPGKDSAWLEANSEECRAEPRDFLNAIHWFAEPSGTSPRPVGDFLPPRHLNGSKSQNALTPSALWAVNGKHLVRWGPEQPDESAQALTCFKLDASGVDNSEKRKAFLREFLFFLVPCVLGKMRSAGLLTTKALSFRMGFAYPLTLQSKAFEETKVLLKEVCQDAHTRFGLEIVPTLVSESMAIKVLLGEGNTTDTFLVADLGGGTMDLSIFTGNKSEPDQMGSLEFGGERLVDACAPKTELTPLQLSDLIRNQQCDGKFGGDQAITSVVNRFFMLALDYLQMMIGAYRESRPGQSIYLVLAGNGWHLVEHFSGETAVKTPGEIISEYYRPRVDAFGHPDVQLERPMPQLPSSKHFVAVGVLKHLVLKKMDGRTSKVMLPAGFAMSFSNAGSPVLSVEWRQLVGDGVCFRVEGEQELKSLDLHVQYDGQSTNGTWKAHLLKALKTNAGASIPRSSELQMREWIRSVIIDGIEKRLLKGPRQLELENYWSNRLDG